ncbi:hypothetical protein [Rhodanobacter hydrolyticus]|uniref:Uncharacterized protein n=1 Tax=Rhodanobacter hydrolyticus TaxID=2250595 RepID=A0ABW8J3R7_9GAMM
MNARADTAVERPAPLLGDYYRSTECENAVDVADRKLAQAEALSQMMYGEEGKAFRGLGDDIQDNIHWLLSDLLGECRLYRRKARQEAANARMEAQS